MVLSLSKFCILTKITTTGIRTVQLFDFFCVFGARENSSWFTDVSLYIKWDMSDTLSSRNDEVIARSETRLWEFNTSQARQ